ncbi:DUF5131 family protein [Mycobacterium malmoense]|uniref:DUF5131 family protein n=1 Tax=Mycobacterium malmoense TaxID=1780 RepID=UPI0008F88174|nr:phage Gp37/Gp68 family protein [Mycobacterium malmoense]OIN80750.1 hypothetical protein BMG05_10395 [Mycobacterium malmoense]
MADKTGIEWADATWNPVTGCTEVSPGCDHCYAKTFAERWRGTPGHYFEHGFDVQLRPDKLGLPLRWRRPRRIFVNSMSDLFHDQVPDDYIAHVFAIMQSCAAHTFQVLTKRHARMRSLLSSADFWQAVTDFGEHVMRQRPSRAQLWPYHGQQHGFLPNVWLGVSAENQQWADIRIPALLDTPATVRFISAEPLLGPLSIFASSKIDRDPGLDWVIVGGESGHGARPMHPSWARALRDECVRAGVPFLFKQWGGWAPVDDPFERYSRVTQVGDELMYAPRSKGLCVLDGRTWDQYPETADAP